MSGQTPSPAPDAPQAGSLGAFQFLTIAIGCMIGIGWITVLGEWLERAGPIGSMVGFGIGALVFAGVAACYAELTAMMPQGGGDVLFAERVFGRRAAFFVGWFLVLLAISVAAFEGLSFAWIASTLLPQLGETPAYRFLGEVVTVQEAGLGFLVVVLLFVVNIIGVGASSRTQDILTIFKFGVMFAFLCAAVVLGEPARLLEASSALVTDVSGISGILWVAATSAFWFGGFQVISQAAGARNAATSLRTIGIITASSVLIGLLFYWSVIIAATSAAPVEQIVQASLPAAAAARAAFGSDIGASLVLLAGISGIVATLNAMLVSGSRLTVAMSALDLLPSRFGRVSATGSPVLALTGISAVAALATLGGKGLLIPIVNTASISLILSYVAVCAATWTLRRREPATPRAFKAPGGGALIAFIGVAISLMAAFIVLEPALKEREVPVQWLIFVGWALLGTIAWQFAKRRLARLPTGAAAPAASQI